MNLWSVMVSLLVNQRQSTQEVSKNTRFIFVSCFPLHFFRALSLTSCVLKCALKLKVELGPVVQSPIKLTQD